jgi:hypothetical protein
MGSMVEKGRHETMRESQGGTQCGAISHGQSDAKWRAPLYAGESDRISALLRADSEGENDQPQKRNQEGQQAGKSGNGNIFRESDPCRQGSPRRDNSGSKRGEESNGEIDKRWRERNTKHENGNRIGNENKAWAENINAGEEIRSELSNGMGCSKGPTLDHIIVGSETGPGARPFDPSWAISLRDQCRAAGVPFFFKKGIGGTPYLDGEIVREFPR